MEPSESPKNSLKEGGVTVVVLFCLSIVWSVAVHSLWHLPAAFGMMTGLSMLCLYSYILHMKHTPKDRRKLDSQVTKHRFVQVGPHHFMDVLHSGDTAGNAVTGMVESVHHLAKTRRAYMTFSELQERLGCTDHVTVKNPLRTSGELPVVEEEPLPEGEEKGEEMQDAKKKPSTSSLEEVWASERARGKWSLVHQAIQNSNTARRLVHSQLDGAVVQRMVETTHFGSVPILDSLVQKDDEVVDPNDHAYHIVHGIPCEECDKHMAKKEHRMDLFTDVFTDKIEWDSLLLFYGIILGVGVLSELGYLAAINSLMYDNLGTHITNILLGILSAIVDNVPVTFAVLEMDPAMSLGHWLTVTLSVGIGGSLLSVGSASGVSLMGSAKGLYTFVEHLKWSWAVLLGYAAGVGCHLLLNWGLF